jgi:probable HAF family extracellular repeat protein
MKRYWFLLVSLFAVISLTLAGCGGGGGGGGGNPDRDGDGIPNVDDAFPDDPARFASFNTVNLPGLQGVNFSSAMAINDPGLIVGTSNDITGDVHAVFWTDSTAVSPIRFEFPAHPGAEFGAAYGVNNAGDTVGETNNAAGGRDAIFWLGTGGTPQAASPAVMPPIAGAQFTAAYAINNSKRAVGESQSGSITMAVAWLVSAAGEVGQPTLLGVPEGATASSAYFIDDNNRIVGEYTTASGMVHGILWSMNPDGTFAMLDLPPIGGEATSESVAYGINDAGQIVGESTTAAGVVSAVTWTSVAPVVAAPLGTPAQANALAINDSGRLAGWTMAAGANANAGATVWDLRNLALADVFLDPAAAFSQGFGINNSGSIVGMSNNLAFAAVAQ